MASLGYLPGSLRARAIAALTPFFSLTAFTAAFGLGFSWRM